ncbi:MAG: hypothetical protein GY868_16155, partial [Deltaproteobacteria bacterium]|nr:hypothetical protein [Deltaproteobacteria bacterium]
MNKTSRHIILTIIFTITIIGCLPLNTSAGYLVQQGRTLLTSTQQDISITAVNDISRAFVIFNHYYAAGQLDQVESNSNNGEADVACTAAFLSAVNTIQVNRDSAASNVWIDWQVIECSNQEFEVFRDSYAWSDTDGNEITTAIGSTVTPADCLAWISGSTSSASNTTSYETILFRALVSSATEISIRRSGADADITGSLRWIVVAFDPAKIDSIQTGTTTVTNTHVETAPQQVTITAVDISDSLLLFQMGVTSTGLDQCAVSGRLADTTTLEFYTRGTSTTIRDVRYYVIDFGPACGSRQAGTIDYSSNSGWYNHAQALSPAVTPGRTVTFTSLTQDGTGTAFVRPFPNAYIEDGSTYKIWRSRWGQESWIEWQVLELPEPLPPGFQQYSFRGRTDDADESTATWAAAADSSWTQNVDENFRIRFLVQETGGVPQDDKTFQLEYNWNETGWLDIT